MSSPSQDRRLVANTLTALLVGAALVAGCYFFLDRPIAESVHREQFPQIALLRWLTYPPPIMQAWAPLVLALLVLRRAWGPWTRWEAVLFTASVSLIVADQFRQSLQTVFGRDWPQTWINHNPSLIDSGAYGFHWFAGDEEFGSFPSGHMARMAGFFGVYAVAYPRSRPAALLILIVLAVALIGMNYHFLGDVVAGTFIGGLIGVWAAHLKGETYSQSLPTTGTRG